VQKSPDRIDTEKITIFNTGKMIGIIVTLAIIAYFVYKHYEPFRHLPPGPLSLPLIGNLHQLDSAQPHKTLQAWGKQ
jgi:hypothetical protein